MKQIKDSSQTNEEKVFHGRMIGKKNEEIRELELKIKTKNEEIKANFETNPAKEFFSENLMLTLWLAKVK